MTGRQVALTVTTFLVLYFATDAGRAWLAEHYKAKIASDTILERIKLSELETERMKILGSAISKSEPLKILKDEAHNSKMALIRPSIQHEKSRVLGTEITNEEAETILSKEKKKGEGKRLDGIYKINHISTESAEGYIVTIENIGTGAEFSAEVNYNELTAEDIHAIFVFAENKSPIHMLINAWFIDEKIVRAQVMRANSPDDGKQADVTRQPPKS